MDNSRIPCWQHLLYPDWLTAPLRTHLARPRGSFIADTFRTCLLVYRLTLLSPVFWLGVALWFVLEPVLSWPAYQLFSAVWSVVQPASIWISDAISASDSIDFMNRITGRYCFELLPGFISFGMSIACLSWHPVRQSSGAGHRQISLRRAPVIAVCILALPFLIVYAFEPVAFGFSLLIDGIEDLSFTSKSTAHIRIVVTMLIYHYTAGLLAILLLPLAARSIYCQGTDSGSPVRGDEVALTALTFAVYSVFLVSAGLILSPENVDPAFQYFVLLQLFLTLGFVLCVRRSRATPECASAAQIFD